MSGAQRHDRWAVLSALILAALAARCGGAEREGSQTRSGRGGGANTEGSELWSCSSSEDCNDRDLCTLDTCEEGLCAHAPVSRDDTDACTVDACDSAAGILHVSLGCDDHDACTADSCDAVAGCLHAPISVDDGDACTADACAPEQGVTHAKVSCDDGDLCTVDSCDVEAGCVHAPQAALKDANACTEDTCDPLTGAVTHTLEPGCCPHSACSVGAPLNAACSYAGFHEDCVALVCAHDPFCCQTIWDSVCVTHTRDPAICPTGLVPSWFSCSCGHSYCKVGAPLSKRCDPCVKKICDKDPSCCVNVWDAICVNEVASECDVPSGADCK